MKDIFRKFLKFSAKRQKTRRRKGKQVPQKTEKIGCKVAQAQGESAQHQEIENRAPKNRAQKVEPHLPAAYRHGKDKNGRGDHQPKGQVKKGAQNPAVQPHPKHPEQIVKQAHRSAQCKGKQQSEGLGGYRDLHTRQRKSREKRPVRC